MSVVKLPGNKEIETSKATEILGAMSQINSIKSMKEDIKNYPIKFVGDKGDSLNEVVKDYTVDELTKMSDEKIDEIYKKAAQLEGEEDFEIAIDFGDKKKVSEFKKDFLLYIRGMDETMGKLDEQIANIENEIKDHMDTLKELTETFGDISTLLRHNLQEAYDNCPDEEVEMKQRMLTRINAFDDAYNLDRIYNIFSKYGVKGLFGDFNNRQMAVYERFKNRIDKLKINADITDFVNLEERFFPEFKDKLPNNIFIFSVIKMFSHNSDCSIHDEGIFISQLMVNLKSLYSDTFPSEEKKEGFLNAIRRVLELFQQ